jgi:hypothetical protein
MARRYLNAFNGAREAARRMRVAFDAGRERVALERLAREPLHLKIEYHYLPPPLLLERFRERQNCLFKGFSTTSTTARLQQARFPAETKGLTRLAEAILMHRWPLLGFGEMSFGEHLNWLRDPLTKQMWPSVYHGDISLVGQNGSDVRVLWELNRLGHFLTLGRAYAVTDREEFALEVFEQFDSWLEQNRLGYGPNWSCAMEVSLRAMNLLAALSMCRHSSNFTPERLSVWLHSLAQHGAHIKRNLEFSHLGTTNHYLTNVVGILWLGLALPELALADEWSEWGFRQLLAEMDKQILPDGADYEGSTGYHRYITELFLYSFILCRQHNIEIDAKHWQRLRSMLLFVQYYVRPDKAAPLIGDTDGSQVLPITMRRADDHLYLLGLGAVALQSPELKCGPFSEELLWVCGADGMNDFDALSDGDKSLDSKAFHSAGLYVLRDDDLYLLFNTARHERAGRSSHRHNDALSIEVSACGRAFIVDPGTYVYSADRNARHLFRSTAYHSTIQVDDAEQNRIEESQLFVFGNEARPKTARWQTSAEADRVSGRHFGYERLPGKVRHERSVVFDKRNRWWLLEDRLLGTGTHRLTARFHLANGLEVVLIDLTATIRDPETGVGLLILLIESEPPSSDSHQWVPKLESQFVSRQYGSRLPSTTVAWSNNLEFPCRLSWVLVPVSAAEDQQARVQLVKQLFLKNSN